MSKRRIELVIGCHGRAVHSGLCGESIDLSHVAGCYATLTKVAEPPELDSCSDSLRTLRRWVGGPRSIGAALAGGALARGRVLAELGAVHPLTVDHWSLDSLAIRNNRAIWAASLSNLLGKLRGDLVGIVFIDASGDQQVPSPLNVSRVVVVLSGVGCLVFENLDELVEPGREDRTKDWPNPVDPVVGVESVVDDSGTERTCRVEGTASEVYSSQLGDE